MLSTAHGVIPTHSSVCRGNTSSLTAWTATVVFVVVQVVAHTAYLRGCSQLTASCIYRKHSIRYVQL